MDEHLRALKRKAIAGDKQAFDAWFRASLRSGIGGIKDFLSGGHLIVAVERKIDWSDYGDYVYDFLRVLQYLPEGYEPKSLGWNFVIKGSGSTQELTDLALSHLKLLNFAYTPTDPLQRITCDNCHTDATIGSGECACGELQVVFYCPYCSFTPLTRRDAEDYHGHPYTHITCSSCSASFEE